MKRKTCEFGWNTFTFSRNLFSRFTKTTYTAKPRKFLIIKY